MAIMSRTYVKEMTLSQDPAEGAMTNFMATLAMISLMVDQRTTLVMEDQTLIHVFL